MSYQWGVSCLNSHFYLTVYRHTVLRTIGYLQSWYYLCAIGLGIIEVYLTLGYTPKQPDSRENPARTNSQISGSITLYGQWPLSSWNLTGHPSPKSNTPPGQDDLLSFDAMFLMIYH